MQAHQSRTDSELTPRSPIERRSADQSRIGLDDPRAVSILTTEHWSLLSARTLAYQEMFGRTTIFIAILSATIVALAPLAQATGFGRPTLWLAIRPLPDRSRATWARSSAGIPSWWWRSGLPSRWRRRSCMSSMPPAFERPMIHPRLTSVD